MRYPLLTSLFLWLTLTTLAQGAVVFPRGSSWKYFKGTAEASSPDPAAWRSIGFNDAGWLSGNAAFFYEDGSGYSGNTVLTDMRNGYSCIFMRKTFSVGDPANVGTLDLDVSSDDGCVIWINGVEVASLGRPTNPLTFQSVAPNANGEPKTGTFTVSDTSFLVAGNNVVAVQAFNRSFGGSSDFLIDLSLSSSEPDLTAPTITTRQPLPGTLNALRTITVNFSEPVLGVDALDLLVNGMPANSVSGGPENYTFDLFPPPFGLLDVTWAEEHGIADYSANPFDASAPGATWQYHLVDDLPPTIADRAPPAGLVVRRLHQIEVQFSENVVGVNAADLLINGAPATNVVVNPGGQFLFQFPEPAVGTVQVAWASGHGITDLAETPNPFAGAPWTYVLDPQAAPPDLVLNEMLTANRTGLTDETGLTSDWIEIWNRGPNAVDLAGWSLSDDPVLPGKWVFPSHVLAAGDYLVVFATGRNIKQPSGNNPLHTNFKLGSLGEWIGLYSPDSPREPAAGVFGAYPQQRNDHSYGLDAQGALRYFARPTPGGPNGESTITGVVEPVHFSAQRGYFEAPFDLVLTTPTPGATIRYTTDGSEPTETIGIKYTTPLRIAQLTLLRAAAFRTNLLPSPVTTHSFLFNLSAAFRSLPVISIVTDSNNVWGPTGILGISGGNYSSGPWNANDPNNPNEYHNPKASLKSEQGGDAWERPTSVEWITEDNSGFQEDAGLRVHGSNWTRPRYRIGDKFAFKLYFRGDYGHSRLNFPWFPGSVDHHLNQVVLRDGHNDGRNPFIIDSLIRHLHADMGQAAVHDTFGNLLLNGVPMIQSGQPENFYFNPVNRVKEGFLQAWHGGSLNWDIIAPFGDFQGGGDRVEWNSFESFIRNQSDTTQQGWYEEVQRRLDLVNFVDYLLVNIYGATWDWPHNNWRAARERTPEGIWRFYVWDAEGAFYTHSSRANVGPSYNNFTDTSQGLADTEEIATFYKKLRGNAEFRLLFADRIQKHFFNNGALTEQHITDRFNEMKTLLSQVIVNMDSRIINNWVPARRGFLWTQFASQGLLAPIDAPTFNQPGGAVARGFPLTITGPGGSTVYYTTNGADPRLQFTGAVAPEAAAYAPGNPLRLNQSVLLKARARNGNNWSALTEAAFEVGSLGIPLRITEIMYHPAGGNRAQEYLELQNVGTAPLDLSGMTLEGVAFTFPQPSTLAPGGVLVLASDNDPAAFAARYPGVTVFGWFGGSLANGGERLAVRDTAGHTVVSVDYLDDNGWPQAADGGGYSLEIVDPFGPPDEPANWRASRLPNGSPGVANAAGPALTVQLNELMADNLTAVSNANTVPDWIELRNAGPVPVDLAGWSLSDDGNVRKFIFPANTLVPADGYRVVWCDSVTNTTPGLHTGFALDRDGETVSLYNTLFQRVDAVTYGLQLADYSLGRHHGDWTLTLPTPNQPNSPATLGAATDLSLNEWMANPTPGEDDWLELYNQAAQPVSLNGLYVQVDDAIQQLTALSFIAPGGYVQLLADNGVGPKHLDLRLSASGATLVLLDAAANEIERVTYTLQNEGVSRGRLPDGSPTLVNFVGSASPGAANYQATYSGPEFNEIMARNQSAATNTAGRAADWVELHNPSLTPFDLTGMSLSVDAPEPGQWPFPANVTVPAQGYLVIWCDGDVPASTTAGPVLNLGRSLGGDSGGIYLFNAAGQLVHSQEYGFQVEDQSIGLAGGQWQLLASPTPGAANAAPAALGVATGLRLNEWMAAPESGDDWFELYNPESAPVDLSGLFVTDDPSVYGRTRHQLDALSYIGGKSWVRILASGSPGRGRNHVDFSLDALGEMLRIYRGATLIDSVEFGAQRKGVSQGRLPDGGAEIADYVTTASPGRANYLSPAVIINEVLAHAASPLEEAIELHNPTANALDLGGWYLSDSAKNFQKYQLPANTVIPAGGYVVIYEHQFNDGSPNAFALSSAYGGTVWLSEAGPGGGLTGYRTQAEFEPSADGVSLGPVPTGLGVDFVALNQRSFGADHPATVEDFRTGTGQPNTGPAIPGVVISEIMYHPPDLAGGSDGDNTRDEYVELHNWSSATVALFDPGRTTNTWRVRGAVEFDFPAGVSLAAGERLLLVSFNPATDPVSLNAFRSAYGLTDSVPLFGPWRGQLGNGGETLRLLTPDTPQAPPLPDAGFVPYITIDRVQYLDQPPWPAGAVDGGGLSLQKAAANAYGNDPLNWVAGAPTPGAPNGPGIVAPPQILTSPQDQTAFPKTAVSFSVQASGAEPLSYQWRFNGRTVDGATSNVFVIDYATILNDGEYDVVVSNPGGSVISARARLRITAPPEILQGPMDQTVDPGTNVTLTVNATGPGPLTYAWRHDGQLIPGAAGPTLVLSDVQLADHGEYEVFVSNPNATVSATGKLTVLVAPTITQQPTPATIIVGEGDTFTITVSAVGTPPIVYRFRSPRAPYFSVMTLDTAPAVLVVENAKTAEHQGRWTVAITNIAGRAPLSQPVMITVNPAPPHFAVQPTNQSVLAGADAELVAEARGSDPITYQWYFNATNTLAAATNATLTVSNVQSARLGQYTVVAANSLGMATSQVAELSILEAPLITTQPTDQQTTVCSNATFTVSAIGGEGLGYQWYFNRTNLLAGATGDTLILDHPTPSQAGNYTVVASNPSGATTSSVAVLTLLLGDNDNDGMPDAWELANGLNPCDPSDRDLDPDHDGRTNWEESVSGTNPHDTASILKVRLLNGGASGATIEFTAAAEVGYTIQFRPNLTTGAWQKLVDIAPEPQAHAVSINDSNAGVGGNRFYRIVTPRMP